MQNLINIIKEKNGIKDIPPLSTNLGIEHWLPLLPELTIYQYWKGMLNIYSEYRDLEDGIIAAQYDFQKSFKDQSPEFHQFLLKNIK